MTLTRVHNRMIEENIFNIVDYGGDPTGVSDSTAAINSAFAAVETKGSGTVYFPAGEYLVTATIGSSQSSNLTDIKVCGDTGAKINCNPSVYANYGLFLYWPNLRSIIVEDLIIDGNDKTASGISIRNQSVSASCDTAIVQRCKVLNIKAIDNAGVTVSPTGIYIDSIFEGINAVVRDCIIEDVTRSKTGLATSGIIITKFRNTVISNNYINNIRHSGVIGDKVDADGIKMFAIRAAGSFYDVTSEISNNTILDCEGRAIKLQGNGSVLVQNNNCRVQGAIELIDNYHAIDSQAGESVIKGNEIYFDDNFTGAGSGDAIGLAYPDATQDYNYQSFRTVCDSNKIFIRKKIPYVITYGAMPASTVIKVYTDITNNTVSVADDDLTTTDQATERPSHFCYANTSSWPTVANFTGEAVINVSNNIVDTYEFFTWSGGTGDYTDKIFLTIRDNIKYPTGFGRNLLSASTFYTSSLLLSGNQIGSVYNSGGVYWEFDFKKLLSGCNFYNASGTRTNGPAAYSFRQVETGGGIFKVIDGTGMYLSQDATTWTRIS